MKKFFLLLSFSLLLTGCNNALKEAPSTPLSSPFVFEEKEFDFGTIKQSGGIVQHDFSFTYTGEAPITITSTPGSCACTTAEVDKKELSKGDSGVLSVSFNPNLHAEPEGRFSKTISIMTDPPLNPVPEVTVWQHIDLDLGEEAFELSRKNDNHDDNETMPAEKSMNDDHQDDEEDEHVPDDHEISNEIGHDGSVPPLENLGKKRSFTLTAQEINGTLDEGMTYLYWTYDGIVPGPFLRAKVGETIEVTLKNPSSNHMPHSIDLHAVNGPGGGAVDVHPGQEKTFSFKALNPGIYIYHCGTKEVAEHMTNGAYGLILIEPEEGLSPVDKELYVVQGEFYSILDKGQKGATQFSGKKLKAEQPEFIVMNGRVGSLTGERALKAQVGDKIRIFVGNGGVSKVSSFHVIGEIFDTVYPEGGTPAQHNIQTTVIPAGGATIVEFTVDVPGTYKLVDHALARLNKGAVAELIVTGKDQPSIFQRF
jgi:nitrite reductase (NO-forming)